MTLSIVIANWNTRSLIEECLTSIFETTPADGLNYEIIVIDNASSDGSREYLRGLEDKITLIENSVNLGYAKACNQGMKASSGKYILLLGSDTIMLENTLKECVSFLDNNNEAGAVACRLLNPDGTVQNSLKKFPKLKNAFYTYLSFNKLNREYDMADFDYSQTCTVEQAAATFLMIKKAKKSGIKIIWNQNGIGFPAWAGPNYKKINQIFNTSKIILLPIKGQI